MKKLFITLIIAVAGAIGAAAQKAEVESFQATPIDLTAQKYAPNDLNGRKCALVKVQVIATGVEFSGNIIGTPEKHTGEYWVYMTHGTKMLKIVGETFLPFMYDFPEPLQSGVTYVLTISTPQQGGTAAPQRKKQNFLALKVTPATARVTVDGVELPLENGAANKLLAAGAHTFRVTATGYAPHEETVTIADQKVARTVTLRSVKPTLSVTATTPGTEIYINDERRGTDRWSGELFSDAYVIEGRLASHRTHTQTVTLADNETRTVTIPALAPVTGTLSIDYLPQDAAVTIDGRAAGTTPLLLDDVLIGSRSVTISKDGYTPATLTATVSETTPATLSGSLKKAPIYSGPSAADIALTNEYEAFDDSSTGKWGYRHKGRVVIPAKYDWSGTFSEGLAEVYIAGKGGYIDKTGTVVIPAKYEEVWSFSEGLAKVKIAGKWGYIDKTGTVVIPAQYDDAWVFTEGLAAVKIDSKCGAIDKAGTLVVPAIYDKVEGFSEDLAVVKIGDKYGYTDREGRLVIPAQYSLAGWFKEGLAWVEINHKYGFVDKTGTLVIPAIYDDCHQPGFSSGKILVELNGRTFHIDKNGKEVK